MKAEVFSAALFQCPNKFIKLYLVQDQHLATAFVMKEEILN
jgi:hypothetical protein